MHEKISLWSFKSFIFLFQVKARSHPWSSSNHLHEWIKSIWCGDRYSGSSNSFQVYLSRFLLYYPPFSSFRTKNFHQNQLKCICRVWECTALRWYNMSVIICKNYHIMNSFMCHCNGILKIKYSYLSVRGEQNREKFHLVSFLHEVILWENGPFFFILFLWEFTSHSPYPSHCNMLAFMLKKKWYHDGHNEDMQHSIIDFYFYLILFPIFYGLCTYAFIVYSNMYILKWYTHFLLHSYFISFYYCHLRRNKVYISP